MTIRHKYYLIILLLLLLVLPIIAQVRIKENNVVTFKGSISNTKLTVKNMGTSSSFEFTGPKKPLPENATILTKDDEKRKWIFALQQGSLFTQSWFEMPADYGIQIITPFGTFSAYKQTQFYIVAKDDLVKIVLQKGKGTFIGAVSDQFTVEHSASDTLVNFTFTVPEQSKPTKKPAPKIDISKDPLFAENPKILPPPMPSILPPKVAQAARNIPITNVESPQNAPANPQPDNATSSTTTIPIQPIIPAQPIPPNPALSPYVKATESEWKTGLAVLHYDTMDPAPVGETFNYVIKLTNKSEHDIKNIRLSSNIPDTTMLIIANATSSNVGILPFKTEYNHIIFDSVENLAPNQNLTYTITLKVKQPGQMYNNIRIKSDSFDSVIQNEETTKSN